MVVWVGMGGMLLAAVGCSAVRLELREMARASATANGALHVDLFKEAADDPFLRDQQRLHAADGLHPSDDGYAIWYEELRTQSALRERLP